MNGDKLKELSRWGAMSEADFDHLIAKLIDRPVAYYYELMQRITVSQSVTEILLNEIEARGLLILNDDGSPFVPYIALESRITESILSREEGLSTYSQPSFVNMASNSAFERARPSSVSTTDFALPLGSEIDPLA